jgi:small GTP-binding protein
LKVFRDSVEAFYSTREDRIDMVKTCEQVRTMDTSGNQPDSVAITPDDRYVIFGAAAKINPSDEFAKCIVHVGEFTSGRVLKRLLGHTNAVNAVAITPDGKQIVSGSKDHTIRVWDLVSGNEIKVINAHDASIRSLALTRDGTYAVSGSEDNSAQVWDLKKGTRLRTFEGHDSWVRAVAITPDSQLVVTGSFDLTLKVWELATGRLVYTLSGHKGVIYSVAITPDGRYALSGSGDRTVKIWDLTTGSLVRSLEGHSDAVISVNVTPDGQHVISGSKDKTIRIQNLASGELVRLIEDPRITAWALATTSDSRYFVSAATDNFLRIWDLAGKIIEVKERPQEKAVFGKFRVFKLSVLGAGGTGKTTMLHRYVSSIFCADTSMTIGIQFHLKQFGKFTLQLWDHGGQERFRFLMPTYLSGTSGAIYVLDLSREGIWDDWKSWYPMYIEKVAHETAPFIIAANKSDMVEDVDFADRMKALHDFYGTIRAHANYPIVVISAKTGSGIEEVFFILVIYVFKELGFDMSELSNIKVHPLKYDTPVVYYLPEDIANIYLNYFDSSSVDFSTLIPNLGGTMLGKSGTSPQPVKPILTPPQAMPLAPTLQTKPNLGGTILGKTGTIPQPAKPILAPQQAKPLATLPQIKPLPKIIEKSEIAAFQDRVHDLSITKETEPLFSIQDLDEFKIALNKTRLINLGKVLLEIFGIGDSKVDINVSELWSLVIMELKNYWIDEKNKIDINNDDLNFLQILIKTGDLNKYIIPNFYTINGYCYALVGLHHFASKNDKKAGMAFYEGAKEFITKDVSNAAQFFMIASACLSISDHEYFTHLLDSDNTFLSDLVNRAMAGAEAEHPEIQGFIDVGFRFIAAIDEMNDEIGVLDPVEAVASSGILKANSGEILKHALERMDQLVYPLRIRSITPSPAMITMAEPISIKVAIQNFSKQEKRIQCTIAAPGTQAGNAAAKLIIPGRTMKNVTLLVGRPTSVGKALYSVEIADEYGYRQLTHDFQVFIADLSENMRIAGISVINETIKEGDNVRVKLSIANQGHIDDSCFIKIKTDVFELVKNQFHYTIKGKQVLDDEIDLGTAVKPGIRKILFELYKADNLKFCDEKIIELKIGRSWQKVLKSGVQKGVSLMLRMI